jgi:peptidoglycan/LPS O-acetylase OafA/YrhL
MGRKEKDRKGPDRAEVEEKARQGREAVAWVMRRLDVLEYLILFFALVLALIGGALVAWVLGSALDLPFRATWGISSILLFILPGGFVYLREFRKRGDVPPPKAKTELKDPNG